MIEQFRKALKDNGQSVKWFYDSRIRGKLGIGYSGFNAQLNGYAPLSNPIQQMILEYLKTNESK